MGHLIRWNRYDRQLIDDMETLDGIAVNNSLGLFETRKFRTAP